MKTLESPMLSPHGAARAGDTFVTLRQVRMGAPGQPEGFRLQFASRPLCARIRMSLSHAEPCGRLITISRLTAYHESSGPLICELAEGRQ